MSSTSNDYIEIIHISAIVKVSRAPIYSEILDSCITFISADLYKLNEVYSNLHIYNMV